MKKIIYTISTLQRSGPALILFGLIKNLDRKNFNPTIITLSKEKANSLKPDFEKMGVKIICLNKKGISTFLGGAYNFRRIIKEIKPDIIHANGFRDILLTAFFLPKKYKKCATVHSDWEVDYQLKYGHFVGFISSWFQKQALRCINIRIACSQMLAELLNKKYTSMHFDFVNNGVDTERFSPIKDKTVLRHKLGLPLDKKIIIWVGSFIPIKNPLALVKAIKRLPQDKYYFIFCGARGSLLNVCKEEFKNRNDVLFTGYITNIYEYFQASDIYISTSLNEGFHLTVYEALACGLQVILTGIPAYKLLRKQIPVTLFETNNIIKLSDCISNSSNEKNQLGINLILTNYSCRIMAGKYMEKYN